MKPGIAQVRFRRSSAFSLTEMLIAVALLSLIVFALYAIFDQTQKALRANLQQSEMNESARPAMDLMVRDVERAHPLGINNQPNFIIGFAHTPSALPTPAKNPSFVPFVPQLQSSFFFNQEGEHTYRALGYFIGNSTNAQQDLGSSYVGTLYKYEDTLLVTNRTRRAPGEIIAAVDHFFSPSKGGLYEWRAQRSSRLVEGVVHFRVTPSGADGLDYYDIRTYPPQRLRPQTNDVVFLQFDKGLANTSFLNARMPSFVEIELGVLDSKTLETYRSIGNTKAAGEFLNHNAGKVQLFRQRIPLRTALR